MNISVFCREATKDDLPAVLSLHEQLLLDEDKVLSLLDAEQIFERIGHYPYYKIFVAVQEGIVVGTFALLVMDNLGHMGAPSAIIEDVAVKPNLQGHGVGKAMMSYALKICSEKGCYKAVLSSNLKRERAHTFYESLGFERHGYSFLVSVPPDPWPK